MTITLAALAETLKRDYEVISMDFQTLSYSDFASEQKFVAAFSRELLDCGECIPDNVKMNLELYSMCEIPQASLSVLFKSLILWCKE